LVITDYCTGVSRLLWARSLTAPHPKVYAYANNENNAIIPLRKLFRIDGKGQGSVKVNIGSK